MARVSVDQRRSDLVAAAFRVMSQTGIGQATTRAICAEAGVHQSVFHYSFNSKKELLQELVRVVVVDMTDAAILVSEVDSGAGSSIRSAFRVLWEQVKVHPDRQLVAYELTTYVMRDPELADLAKWQYEQYFKQAERFAMAIETSASIEWSVPMADVEPDDRDGHRRTRARLAGGPRRRIGRGGARGVRNLLRRSCQTEGLGSQNP